MTEKDKENLRLVLDFVERWNKMDKEVDVADAAEDLQHLICEHQCSSNCRREGCNCLCGEWHQVAIPII
jgi:hypothetical protein